MEPIPMPPGIPPSRARPRSSRSSHRSDRGPPGPVVPIVLAVLCAMIAIPAISLNAFGELGDRGGNYSAGASHDSIRLSELPVLPHRPEQSQLEDLKDWLRDHFSEQEIAEMKERFVGDRSEAEVVEHIDRLAVEVSRGNFTGIPREVADLVRSRIGEHHTRSLKKNVLQAESSPEELRLIPLREVYPLSSGGAVD